MEVFEVVIKGTDGMAYIQTTEVVARDASEAMKRLEAGAHEHDIKRGFEITDVRPLRVADSSEAPGIISVASRTYMGESGA